MTKSNLRNLLLQNGFVVLSNFFSKEQIVEFRDEVETYFKNKTNILKNSGGYSIPDFVKLSEFAKIKDIINNEKLNEYLDEIFGSKPYRFTGHNDIGVNRIVGWHKDKLNGDYAKYQKHDIWKTFEGEQHEIVKVLIYLQDHSKNNDGLKLVPKSHLTPKINSKGHVQLRPNIGDVIVFDQRITHRGMDKQVPNRRILVSFGFGKNNIFTDEFEEGTKKRQDKQNS